MGEWLYAFALTVAVELPIVVVCAPHVLRRRAALDSVLANLLTHPLAWLAIVGLGWSWTGTELAVAVVETCVYRGVTRMSWARAALAALCANGVTAALSFVV